MDVQSESLVVVGALVIFGVAYDRAVAELGNRPGGHAGFTALLVVVGVAVTVLMLWPLLGTDAVEILVVGFCASGVPMVAGSVQRYLRSRAAEIEELRRIQAELMDHDRA